MGSFQSLMSMNICVFTFSDMQFLNSMQFRIFEPFSVNPRDGLPHSHARFEPQPVVLTMSTRLNAWTCCHVISRFDILQRQAVEQVCMRKSPVFLWKPSPFCTILTCISAFSGLSAVSALWCGAMFKKHILGERQYKLLRWTQLHKELRTLSAVSSLLHVYSHRAHASATRDKVNIWRTLGWIIKFTSRFWFITSARCDNTETSPWLMTGEERSNMFTCGRYERGRRARTWLISSTLGRNCTSLRRGRKEREQKALNQLSGVTRTAADDSVGSVLQTEQTWRCWMMEEDKNKEFSVQKNIHSIYKETCKQYMVDFSYPGSPLWCWMLFLRSSCWEKKIWRPSVETWTSKKTKGFGKLSAR